MSKILISGLGYKLFSNNFSKDLFLSVYKGIKYLTRLENSKEKILKKLIG